MASNYYFSRNVCLFSSQPLCCCVRVSEGLAVWSGLCSHFPALSLPNTETQQACPLFFYCRFLSHIHLCFLLFLLQASRDQQEAEKCEWKNIFFKNCFSESFIC